MKKCSLLLLAALLCIGAETSRAQFGSFGDIPIEITAEGETRFLGGVAVAENNVSIHYGTLSIYSDYAQYNPDTRDVLVSGNVRIYREGQLFVGDRALYNLETKVLRTADFEGGTYPFFFEAKSISSLEGRALQVNDAALTTSDSSKPDYRVTARTVRIYPGDRLIFSNAKLVIGETPVFWFPYYYQSLNRDEGFSFTPGYDGNWGAFVLTQFGFPVSENVHGLLHLDLRSQRGAAIGLDLKSQFGAHNESWMLFKSYYAHDTDVSANPTALPQDQVSPDRYRVAFQSRTFFTEDIYAIADINKLSDRRFLRDFYPNDYRINPQPDNVVALTKTSENYTVTGIARFQANEFFDTTERLPEVVLDVKRQPIFGLSWLFYEGETGIANLHRKYGDTDDLTTASLPSAYQAARFDSFHQLLAPQTYFGWLSVTPRVGYRGTFYSDGARTELQEVEETFENQGLELNDNARTLYQRASGSGVYRSVVNAGVESSFKFSREWENVQSRSWGLDGLRHIVQPYTNFSAVYSSKQTDGILQFDRINPSTQLPPLDFPQFTTLDSITDWSIWRLGVRNRLQTRRDNRTINWLEMDTFFDVYFDNPSFPGTAVNGGSFSNVYNRLTFSPLPWATLQLDSQLPILDTGFTQVDTNVTFMPHRDVRLTVGHRYLDGNPYFLNSSNLRVGAYYRVNDNWGVSFREQYEFSDNTLEIQEYALHRDLSSWVASLGFQVRDNHKSSSDKNVTDYSVVLTFTLKDLPAAVLPLSYDPSSLINE